MSAVPDGWEVGARLRRLDGTVGVIVYMGKEWAVLDTDEDHDVFVSYYGLDWTLVPPIPEDIGTVIRIRDTVGRLAVRYVDGWYQDGEPVPDWTPDPTRWQQLVPKEQQP